MVLSATFVQLLNVTVAQVAAPSMQAGLGAGPGAVQLILAGYTLAYACLLITAARLGDRYGYRRLFVAGTVVFAVGSVACAAAPDATWLIAARLVQGAGSGLVAPQVLSIIQVAVPAERRARAMGLYGATMGVASLSGPLVGGLLVGADLFGLGWRPVFLVTVPVALVSLAGAAVLPRARGAGGQRVDGVGAVLTTVGFGALVLPLALGREAGWPWWTWAGLAVAVAVLGCFAATLPRRPDPLIHPSVWRDRTARWGVVLVFVFNAGVPSFTYLLFLHLQAALGYPAVAAALMSAPFAAAAVLGSRVAPALSHRHGETVLTVASLVLAGMALALGLLVQSAAGRWAAVPVLAVGGAAFGSFTASVFALVLAKADGAAAGSVSGLLPTAQQLGGSIGVAAAGLAYFASPGGAFWHAMIYEAAVFVVAALISLRLRGQPLVEAAAVAQGAVRGGDVAGDDAVAGPAWYGSRLSRKARTVRHASRAGARRSS
ncbi:MFS transporter [Nonomuraea sp. K274]|uniref:MFS transporter n=1 Tax=Nonomuraea cypriaca TaxID=1187855 RepID=A0A931A6E8_9ACTN|nr:MFS transporter [Nonomuraea cypriaca]